MASGKQRKKDFKAGEVIARMVCSGSHTWDSCVPPGIGSAMARTLKNAGLSVGIYICEFSTNEQGTAAHSHSHWLPARQNDPHRVVVGIQLNRTATARSYFVHREDQTVSKDEIFEKLKLLRERNGVTKRSPDSGYEIRIVEVDDDPPVPAKSIPSANPTVIAVGRNDYNVGGDGEPRALHKQVKTRILIMGFVLIDLLRLGRRDHLVTGKQIKESITRIFKENGGETPRKGMVDEYFDELTTLYLKRPTGVNGYIINQEGLLLIVRSAKLVEGDGLHQDAEDTLFVVEQMLDGGLFGAIELEASESSGQIQECEQELDRLKSKEAEVSEQIASLQTKQRSLIQQINLKQGKVEAATPRLRLLREALEGVDRKIVLTAVSDARRQMVRDRVG
jgi:hypothetical protein